MKYAAKSLTDEKASSNSKHVHGEASRIPPQPEIVEGRTSSHRDRKVDLRHDESKSNSVLIAGEVRRWGSENMSRAAYPVWNPVPVLFRNDIVLEDDREDAGNTEANAGVSRGRRDSYTMFQQVYRAREEVIMTYEAWELWQQAR